MLSFEDMHHMWRENRSENLRHAEPRGLGRCSTGRPCHRRLCRVSRSAESAMWTLSMGLQTRACSMSSSRINLTDVVRFPQARQPRYRAAPPLDSPIGKAFQPDRRNLLLDNARSARPTKVVWTRSMTTHVGSSNLSLDNKDAPRGMAG